jgi:CRP/FNR family transcriptional regulator, cyclic AMP receptor protein
MREYAYIHEEGRVPDPLLHIPFLECFTAEQLDEMLYASAILECEPGDIVIEEGEDDSRIYVLLAGSFDVLKGGEILTTFCRIGEIFGELAVIDDYARSASVIATEPSFCLAIDQKFLQEIKPKEQYPAFYAALYEFIARLTAARLRSTTARLAEVEREFDFLREAIAAAP